MQSIWSRRHILSGFAAGSLITSSPKVWAQASGPGQGLLARLRSEKKARVGIANNPPYSGIDPDGSLTGLAPTLTKLIMGRLGVPEVEGTAVSYGELVP